MTGKTLMFEVEVSEEQLDEVRRTLDLTGVPTSVLRRGAPVSDGVVLREGYARILKTYIEQKDDEGRELEMIAEDFPGTALARALHALDVGLESLT